MTMQTPEGWTQAGSGGARPTQAQVQEAAVALVEGCPGGGGRALEFTPSSLTQLS
jgi:hypothetical protein